jgi:hypothetical protein
MSEFAMFYLAVGSIPTHWHGRVLECTVGIRAVGVELALFICLVSFDLSWTWVSADTFGVFARCTKGTCIRHVDCSACRRSRRLMDIFAFLVGTAEVEVTHGR